MSRRELAGDRAAARRGQVRARYGAIATAGDGCTPDRGRSSCCGTNASGPCCLRGSGCGGSDYSPRELASVPSGANLRLGCGNPTALLDLKPREIVLDLGSGAGIDCFLAARKVGPRGHVIGVDMTAEMLGKARENARRGRYANVEFRLGEIEHLPVADRSVDVVISNCVVNLSPEKAAVYREAWRVLRPGGRLAISDVLATRPPSAHERADPEQWSGCRSGAVPAQKVRMFLRRAGFREVVVRPTPLGKRASPRRGEVPLGVVPAEIRAVRPREPVPKRPAPVSGRPRSAA
jgi:arsenite methyltransferase